MTAVRHLNFKNFIFIHVTAIEFQMCCREQNVIKIGLLFGEIIMAI